jgi:hypothetical protein
MRGLAAEVGGVVQVRGQQAAEELLRTAAELLLAHAGDE